MNDELATDYDIIVLGTGMPECILAAAAARIGKTVLHMDKCDYYGSEWATFNFDGLQTWIKNHQSLAVSNEENSANLPEGVQSFLKDGEKMVECQCELTINSVIEKWFIRETEEIVKAEDSEPSKDSAIEPKDSEESVKKSEIKNEDMSGLEDSNEPKSQLEAEDVAADDEVPLVAAAASVLPLRFEAEKEEWTIQKIKSLYRRFNFDLAPKLLFSRGDLVELLISSNIARYAEFKSITRVLTYLNGKLDQVPCSRADVFSTKNVSVVEKRMLMKLLTMCMDFEQHQDEYQGFENKTFLEFLKSRKLTPNVQHYMLHAIAMASEKTPTLEGLQSTQRFLRSLGRFGNTPFLWPLYGSGELPQCFCRLCAVFGGVYYLKRGPEALIMDSKDNRVTGIISNGKRLNCSFLVLESAQVPKCFWAKEYVKKYVSRAILITDRTIQAAEKEQITFLRFPAGINGHQVPVSVIELGAGAMACPQNLFVVHLTCNSTQSTAEEDLEPVIDLLFRRASADQELPEEDLNYVDRPQVLWCLFFKQVNHNHLGDGLPNAGMEPGVPDNLLVTSSPGDCFDFDAPVTEARLLFQRAFPGEYFLPRAPDPEEIVIEGNEGESDPGISENSDQQEGNETAGNENQATKEEEGVVPTNENASSSSSNNETNEMEKVE